MNCTKCGTPIPDGAKFCIKCGQSTDLSAEQLAYDEALKAAAARTASSGSSSSASPTSATTPNFDDKAAQSFVGSGKASFKDRVKALRDAKRAARGQSTHTGGGRPILWLIIIVAVLMLALSFKSCAIGTKEPGGKPGTHGYSNTSDLVKDYVKYMCDGNYTKAIALYEPNLLKYYEQSNFRDEVLYIVDDALNENIYSYVSTYRIGDSLDWEASFYEEEFKVIGIDAKGGRDVQVYFTVNTSGGGTLTDYFNFELVETADGWFMVSVYYE